MSPDAAPWGGLVLRPLPGGARSRLWLVERSGALFVLRATTAGEPSLRWQDRAQALAARCGLAVARPVVTPAGRLCAGGFVLEPFLPGAPGHDEDLATIAPQLRRWHAATRRFPPRPGVPAAAENAGLPPALARRCRAALPGGPRSAVHGDLHPGNLLRLPGGRIALLDWEEARRDASTVDLAALRGGPAPAALALETVACWRAEPARARAMARRLAIHAGWH